jgi:hypothetical protein
VDVTISYPPRDECAVQRSESRVVCRACRGHGARRSVRAGETIDRRKPDRRQGRRERHDENPCADRGNIRRRRLHQRHGPVCASAGWSGCSPHPGLVEVGHVPAAVQLRSRPPARCRGCTIPLPGWAVPCPVGRFDPAPGRSDAFVDIDNTGGASHGYAKQGPGTAIPVPRASMRCWPGSPYRCRRR